MVDQDRRAKIKSRAEKLNETENRVSQDLKAFSEGLYKAFREVVAELQEFGVSSISSPSISTLADSHLRMDLVVGYFSLVFLPLRFVANSPSSIVLDIAYGKLLVYPYNRHDAVPMFEYKIYEDGHWTRSGFGTEGRGTVADEAALYSEAFTIIEFLYGTTRTWKETEKYTLDDALKGEKPQLGFGT